MLQRLNGGFIYKGDLYELLSREDPDLETAYIFIDGALERKSVPWYKQGVQAYARLYSRIYQRRFGDKTALSLKPIADQF